MKKVLCAGEALIDFVSNKPGNSLKNTEGFIRKAGGAPANVAAQLTYPCPPPAAPSRTHHCDMATGPHSPRQGRAH